MLDFSDNRLLNILDQNTSFTSIQVKEAMIEIQRRKLLSEFEMKRRFEVGFQSGMKIKEKEQHENYLANEKRKKNKLISRRIYIMVIVVTLVGSIILWLNSGKIFFLGAVPLATAGIALRERKTIFDR